jgi:hypothetical protein
VPLLGIGAVDLIGFLVALAAILAVGALWVFFQPLVSLFNNVRINFLWIHTEGLGDAISNGLEDAMKGIVNTYATLSHDAAHFMWVLGVGIWHAIYNIVTGITQALGLANQAVQTAAGTAALLPDAISGAISSANSYADGVLSVAEADATNLYNSAISTAEGLYNDSIAHADTLYNDAIGTAEGLYNDSIAHADGLYNDAISTAQSLATAAALDGINQADNVYNDLVGQIGSVQDVLNGEIDKVLDDAETFATGAAAAAAALSVAGLLTRVGTLEAEATECLEPLCDTVVPQAAQLGRLGQFLNNLETLAIDGFIIALAAEAVTDPAGVAADVVSVVNDVGGPVLAGFRDLIGV